MSTAQETANKALFMGFHDAMNSRDMDVIRKAIDEIVDPEVVFHAPAPTGESGTRALEYVWETLLRVYPDLHLTVEDLIAEGDRVVGRTTVTGTHRAELMGIAATGRPVTYAEIFIMRFAGGRVAEIWGVVDVFGQLKQLGAIPG